MLGQYCPLSTQSGRSSDDRKDLAQEFKRYLAQGPLALN
jgi:hypothetical protein